MNFALCKGFIWALSHFKIRAKIKWGAGGCLFGLTNEKKMPCLHIVNRVHCYILTRNSLRFWGFIPLYCQSFKPIVRTSKLLCPFLSSDTLRSYIERCLYARLCAGPGAVLADELCIASSAEKFVSDQQPDSGTILSPSSLEQEVGKLGLGI